jgi:hypothetical protein
VLVTRSNFLKLIHKIVYPRIRTNGMRSDSHKNFDVIITEARNFAVKELLPANAEGDREGLRFEDGQVKVPECFHRAYKLLL